LSQALALRSPATSLGTHTCVFANRVDVGGVDHPEHYAQAKPKWNGGYKLIVRLGATANKKGKKKLPAAFDYRIFGVRFDARSPL
jgi:hypothetical protein